MSVSPADFALYSRVTGVPIPRTAAERMRIAPAVHSFVRNQEYADEPNLLQRTAGTIGKLALLGAAAGAGAYALNQYGKKSGESGDIDTPTMLTRNPTPKPTPPPRDSSGDITLSGEPDIDGGNVSVYNARLEVPDPRGKPPGGTLAARAIDFADDVILEEKIPLYGGIGTALGATAGELTNAAKIMQGVDPATIGGPVGQATTRFLDNQFLDIYSKTLDQNPIIHGFGEGVKLAGRGATGASDLVQGGWRGAAGLAEGVGNVGVGDVTIGSTLDALGTAASHDPLMGLGMRGAEAVGHAGQVALDTAINAGEAINYLAHTVPPTVAVGLGGLGAGASLIGALRSGAALRRGVDPKGQSRLIPTKFERSQRIDPYSVTYDRYFDGPVEAAKQFASDFSVSLRPVDNSKLVGDEYQGNDHPDLSPGEESQAPNQAIHGKGLNRFQKAISRPFDAAQQFIEKRFDLKDQMRIAELENVVRKGRADLSPDQQREVVQQLFEREKGAQGTAYITPDTVGGASAPLNVSPDKTSRAVDHITMYPTVSGERAGTMDWHLREWDRGKQENVGSKPYAYNVSDPLNLAMQEMAEEGSLQKESFGKLFNIARKAKLITNRELTE